MSGVAQQFVTRAHMAEALAALREELRGELRAALEGALKPVAGVDAEAIVLEAAKSGGSSESGEVSSEQQRGGTVWCEAARLLPPTAGSAGDEGPDDREIDQLELETGMREYKFQESIWDAAAVERLHFGHFGSMLTWAALLINVAVQIVMCILINDSLTERTIDKTIVEQFTLWRTTVAHNIKFINGVTWRSLARRVCSFEDVPLSEGPVRGLAAISQYLPRKSDTDFISSPPLGYFMRFESVGRIMCIVSLGIWWATVLQEAFSIFDMFESIRLLPRGRTVVSRTDNGYKLEAVSIMRWRLIVGMLFVRAGICVALLTCGTFFLAYTISLGDLLLNAVALTIVLSLDELIFSTLAPISARVLVQSMAPLPKKPRTHCRGLDFKPVIALVFIVAAATVVNTSLLIPQIEILERARSAICGGNLDFVAGVDQYGLVVASNPGVDDLVHRDPRETYVYKAFRELIDADAKSMDTLDDYSSCSTGESMSCWDTLGKLSWSGRGISGGRYSVEGVVDMSLEESGAWTNWECIDQDLSNAKDHVDFHWRQNQMVLHDAAYNITSISSCKDVEYACSEYGVRGLRARQYCPETCGCHDPVSPLRLWSARMGCPASCHRNPHFVDKLGGLSCSDWTPEKPRMVDGRDLLSAVWKSLSTLIEDMMIFEDISFDHINSTLHEGGCPALVKLFRESVWPGDLCAESNSADVRPITPLCPISCGCDEHAGPLCPTACAQRSS